MNDRPTLAILLRLAGLTIEPAELVYRTIARLRERGVLVWEQRSVRRLRLRTSIA